MAVTREADLMVVGAGLAGLAAARKVAEAGRSVVVVEARDRVGGRTLNQSLGGDKVVEMGGQWIGPTQDRMYELAAELGIGTFPTHNEGDEIAVVRGKRYRYSGEMPRMNPLAIADFIQTALRIERLAKRVPRERPWAAARARQWDGQTIETWLGRVTKTRRARSMLELYVSLLLATETASVSLLHLLFYVHSGTSFEVLASIEGGAQQDRIVGGSQLVAIRLAEGLGDAVELEAPARRITQDAGSVRVETDRLTVSARHAIVTVPPALASRIVYEPPLPSARDQLMQRLPHGTVTKVNVVYDEPFWRGDGLKGIAFGTDSLVTAVVDNSPPDGSPGVLAAFIKGAEARRLAREEPEARRKLVLDAIVDYHGPRAGAPEEYHELDWSEEVWTRGCYGAHFTPGTWTEFGPVLREPVGRIYWAGAETSAVWNGYMDGAVRSGERAADEVLA